MLGMYWDGKERFRGLTTGAEGDTDLCLNVSL